MTSKQRADLRRAANGIKTVFNIGKEALSDNLIQGIDQALTARELVKVCVQPAAGITPGYAATEIARKVDAQVVQVIGSRFILYRRNPALNRYGIL